MFEISIMVFILFIFYILNISNILDLPVFKNDTLKICEILYVLNDELLKNFRLF